MKKYVWIFLLVISLIIGGIVYFYNSNKSNSNYLAEKSSFNNVSNMNNTSTNTTKTVVQEEIATYYTKIQNKGDLNRQGNISITCSALNNTIVKPGETFSFCDIVGPSTEDRGYKEANVIIQGIETRGLGGRKLSSKFNLI